MEWLAKLFTKYPEMAVYLAVGIGYLIGRLKFRGVGLGVVTGSLLGGIVIGNFFHVPVSDQAKAMLFLLFLFGIGYSVGPGFFSNLKGEGWRWAVLGVFVPVIGLITAYAVAHSMKLDPGYSAGLLSGSLTESPAIGTASEAIRALSVPEDQKQQWVGHVAVADAICYIFGTLGVILVCASFGPKLLRVDLRAESKKVEENLGIKSTKLGVSRSEEHTSELQSRRDIVCRLLLEKKKYLTCRPNQEPRSNTTAQNTPPSGSPTARRPR